MLVLGLNHGELNASCAIARDGLLLAAAPEERFNRRKFTKDFPTQALRYCLQSAGVAIEGVDGIAQAWNPGAYLDEYNPALSGARQRREDYLYTLPDHLLRFVDGRGIHKAVDHVELHLSGSGLPPITYVQHHRAHAANAFFLSNYDEAAILTCDFHGERESTTLAHGRGTEIKILQTEELPNSIGMIYAAVTSLLGYQADSDEWKVMALSAYDVDASAELRALEGTVRLLPGGRYELDQSYYQTRPGQQTRIFSPQARCRIGGTRRRPR
jgi:carbamoyltransferase